MIASALVSFNMAKGRIPTLLWHVNRRTLSRSSRAPSPDFALRNRAPANKPRSQDTPFEEALIRALDEWSATWTKLGCGSSESRFHEAMEEWRVIQPEHVPEVIPPAR